MYAKERRLIEDIRTELRHGRRCQVPSQDTTKDTSEELREMPLFPPRLEQQSALTLVPSAKTPKQKPSPRWPTGHAEGGQMLLFA
jgi:hypothetical protein